MSDEPPRIAIRAIPTRGEALVTVAEALYDAGLSSTETAYTLMALGVTSREWDALVRASAIWRNRRG
jgi:hypothetical protein